MARHQFLKTTGFSRVNGKTPIFENIAILEQMARHQFQRTIFISPNKTFVGYWWCIKTLSNFQSRRFECFAKINNLDHPWVQQTIIQIH